MGQPMRLPHGLPLWGLTQQKGNVQAEILLDGPPRTGKPSYGLDAPGVVWGLLGGGGAAILTGVLLLFWPMLARFPWARSLGIAALNAGGWCVLSGLLMVASSFHGKFRARDMLLARLHLRGNESLLDVE